MIGDAADRSAQDQVIRVARTLWPPPAHATIQRTSSATAREWLVVPSLRHPRWLLPAGRPVAAQALQRHDLGQRSRWASGLLAALYRRALQLRLPLARVRVDAHADVLTIEDELAQRLGVPVEICVRLGRTRTHRALVLRPIDDAGRIRGYVKMATSQAGEQALRVEAANLEHVRSIGIHSIAAPEVIYLGTWNGRSTLIMSALLPSRMADRRTHMPEQAMYELARADGTTSMRLREAPVVSRQGDDIRGLKPGDSRHLLMEARTQLLERFGDVRITTGCWHGDWVPWNMAWAGDRVQLWDWEHFDRGVPLGWDALHYQAQHRRTFTGTGEQVEREWLDASYPRLRERIGLDADAAEAVIVTYLLQINIRYLLDRLEEDHEPHPRKGWGLPLLSQLSRGTCA